MCKTINKLIILTTLLLCACSNEIKFEPSKTIDNYYNWGEKYRAFYLVSNYNDKEYNKVEKLVCNEFSRIIQANDSLELLHFSFYKRTWNTSRFLSDDPFGHHSPMLPENEHRYGKYFIEWIYYERIKNSNKWIYHSMKRDVTDTIEVKINN